jgi:hypothetical protein
MIPKKNLILMSTTRFGGSDDSSFYAETLLLRWNGIVLIYEQLSFIFVRYRTVTNVYTGLHILIHYSLYIQISIVDQIA